MLRFMQGLLLSIMVSRVHSRLLGWVAAAEATGGRLVRHAGHALEASEVWLVAPRFNRGVVPRRKDKFTPNPPTAFNGLVLAERRLVFILDRRLSTCMRSNELLYYKYQCMYAATSYL